ncbi:MAG: adenosine deaminase family protein [Candidatus Korobacteraceae bacterium]
MKLGSRPFARIANALAIIPLLIGLAATAAAARPASDNEARTARYFLDIRKDPNRLLPFLREMPKGGDLHNHLTGGVYAESFIEWEADKGDCVDPKTLSFSTPPCTEAVVPAADALSDQGLYNRIVDALSMRNWQLSGQSGHDHFFETFGKFSQATWGTTDKMLAQTASRAASQHEVYQELMLTPTGKELDVLAKSVGWDDDFTRLQEKLIANGLPQILITARKEMEAAESGRDKILNCGQAAADPGCQIQQRFIAQVSRGKSKEVVFAQALAGFLLAGADPAVVAPAPHIVGINLVMAEDWYVPMSDFSLHMRMLDYLHKKYPRVHIALHAGELVEGLVPPKDLQFHVRESVEIGHAERIGHGVDVMNETRPSELLREMAGRNVMVEICLTSNDVILGVRGPQHPLREYIRAGVPVALATDDEGVARSDMTHEYLKGAADQDLSYVELKNMARTSLEHAFVAGASLWREGNTFTVVKECASLERGAEKLSASCQRFLDGSEKARLQWELEGQFRQFESQPWKVPTDEVHVSAPPAKR